MSERQDHDGQHLARWLGWHDKAAQAALQVAQALPAGDHGSARARVDELRFLWSVLASGEPHEPSAPDVATLPPTAQVHSGCARETLQIAGQLIGQWLDQSDAALAAIGTEDGVDAGALEWARWQQRLDRALPLAWNFDADLLLVHTAYDPGLLALLRERGQRRVLFLHGDPVGDAPEPQADLDLCVGCDPACIGAFVEALKRPLPKHLARLSADGAVPADGSAEADTEAWTRKQVMSRWMDKNTRHLFGRRWVAQGIGNAPLLAGHRNLAELGPGLAGRPAILVSPGPSLDRNIHLLRQAQGKALLMAPLQTLRRLYVEGIRPDLVLVLDAMDLTQAPFDFFGDVPDHFLGTLVVAANCHPNVIRRFSRVCYFSTDGPMDPWLQSLVGAPLVNLVAPSVSLSAFKLALHWGCSPVVLVGQDLALAGEQQYANDAQLVPVGSQKRMTLPGYHGGTVQTPADYFLFHHHFEQMAADAARLRPEIRLYNCTEGGAFIEGFEHQPLQAVLAQHVQAWPADMADHLAWAPAQAGPALARVRSGLERSLRTLAQCRQQNERCRRLSLAPRPDPRFLNQIGAEEKKLRALVRQIGGFSVVYQDAIDQAQAQALRARSLPENLLASRALYAVIAEGCDFMQPLLEQALQDLPGDSPAPAAATQAMAGEALSAALFP